MNKLKFKEIIKNIELYYANLSSLHEVGIDLYESKFAISDHFDKILFGLLEEIYTTEGIDWISWFIFENDYGRSELEAFDENENLICQDIDGLYEYIQKYQICAEKKP
jgi:hypothetical protein